MILDGKLLASFIQERQTKQVRAIRASGVIPKLAIIKTISDPVIDTYIRMKQRYGDEVGVEVSVIDADTSNIKETINGLNVDSSVHGIIVQMPLTEGMNEQKVFNQVDPSKDVDGLRDDSVFEEPTPTAILWLLAGFNVDVKAKKIAVVGQGRLVGSPLAQLLKTDGHDVTVFASKDADSLYTELPKYNLIISAVGKPGLITDAMISEKCVVVDAGTATSSGKLSGDVDPEVYVRKDVKVSPVPGGVGPLTVCALFENVIQTIKL